jgi:hypothetical protein
MLSRLRFTLLLPLLALVACATSAPPVTGTSFTPVAGDYVLVVAAGTAGAGYFTGNIVVSGSTVSGVFRYTNPGTVCVSGAQDIPFSGSFSGTTLTLTSTSFSNSIAALTVQLPLITNNIGAQVANGTAVISGGTCALASTSLQATLYPSFAGTWTITLTNPNALTETLNVTQSATADGDGQFLANGILISNGVTTSLSGIVSGQFLNLANNGSTVTLSANASASPVSVSIGGTSSGSGTMTH